MERLTRRDEHGNLIACGVRITGNKVAARKQYAVQLAKRVEAYELAGRTPEEIIKMEQIINSAEEICNAGKLTLELYKKLQSDLDRVTRERDAAVECLEAVEINLRGPIFCDAWETSALSCIRAWRGADGGKE